MVKYIIGGNSLGKSMYLRKLYQAYEGKVVVTNLLRTDYTKIPYDPRMIQCLKETYGCGVQLGSVVTLTGLGYEQNMPVQIIESLMMKDADIFILDEPENYVDRKDVRIIFRLLEELRNLNKEVWVVTHDVDLIPIEGVNVYTLKNNILVSVRGEDIEEVMDKV